MIDVRTAAHQAIGGSYSIALEILFDIQTKVFSLMRCWLYKFKKKNIRSTPEIYYVISKHAIYFSFKQNCYKL